MRSATRSAAWARRSISVMLVLGLALSLGPVGTAHADPGWNEAVKWTESVLDAYNKAKDEAAKAAAAVAAAQVWFDHAKAAFDAANGNPATTAATIASMQAAAANLAAAQAALALAKAAVAVAAAAAVGFLAGTGYYQLGWAISDWCWDPICDLVDLDSGAHYTPMLDAELDAELGGLISAWAGVQVTKADFDGSAVGQTAWRFAGEAVRLFIDAARGAAAFSAHRFAEVRSAGADLQAIVDGIPAVMLSAADALDTTDLIPARTPSGRTVREDIAAAMADAQRVIQVISNPPPGDENTCATPPCDNSAALNAAIAVCQALMQADIAIRELVRPDGTPRVLGELFRAGSREEFRAFVQSCRDGGVSCLPEAEVSAIDALFEISGTRSPSSAFTAHVAALDAGADGGEEAALFDGRDSVTQAEAYRISATVLSSEGPWLNIDMSESPLLDTTPPEITASLTPEANAAGWNDTSATVGWSVTDPESGIAFSSGCDPQDLAAETGGTTLACTATNGGGVEATGSVTVRIDLGAPSGSLLTPDGATFVRPVASPHLEATVSDPALADSSAGSGVAEMCFAISRVTASGSTYLGCEPGSASGGVWSADPSLATGVYDVGPSVTDVAGNVGGGDTIRLYVISLPLP